MGDRGNIVIRETGRDLGPKEAVFLYAHWSGENLPEILRQALAKRWRWDDEPYLARIIFDVMLGGHHGTETSFGISTRICDNEHPLLVVHDQRVYWLDEGTFNDLGFSVLGTALSLSFEEYISVPQRTWYNLEPYPSAATVMERDA